MSAPLSLHQVKVLVLYVVNGMPSPLPRHVAETALALCDANIFSIQEALHALLENENLTEKYDEENVSYLFITEQGKSVVDALRKDTPLSYREKAMAYAAAEISKLRTQIGVEAKVSKREKHQGMEYSCDVSLSDNGEPWLTLSLASPNKLQADMMAERFRKAPLDVYRKILQIMTGTDHTDDKTED